MATTNVSNYPGNYIIRATSGTITLYAPNNRIILDSPLTRATHDLQVDGNTVLGSDDTNTIDPKAVFINDLVPQDGATYDIGEAPPYDDIPAGGRTWNNLNVSRLTTWGDGTEYLNTITNTSNVWNPYDPAPEGRPYDPGDIYGTAEQRQQGALYVAGGVGIEKDLNVGGYIYGRIEYANTTTFVYYTATNVDYDFNLTFVQQEDLTDDQSPVYIDQDGIASGLTYNPFTGKLTTDRALIAESDQSTSTNTGALVVAGGVGIAATMTIGGEILPETDLEQNIGSSSTQWAEAYIHDLYTRLITSTTGTVQIDPAAKVTEIVGDIRVRGTNPIGTAPVATNTLYVTMDGDDTNDGRAMDPSRACRTIGGAINSPYYQPGTQIRVAAGHYLEDNPLQLKPYTSIMGSDIRTTSVEPINKTQDLFHLNSGCYLAFMQFLNGRSGLLEGQYAPGFNRGAYCTAFPPLEGEDRIDLYHSPYVQNCTNLSGPWLIDGTMFVPNQTVQVPAAVGIGTWPKGTSTIVVNVSQGSIEQGMTVNAGQQNPGFFNARTLMLANKQFMQEQVVAYVDQTFDTINFEYDSTKCSRDVGLIVDSLATDILYGSTSDTVFAGLQYWNQGSTSVPGEETTTTAAISFLKDQAVSYVTAAATGAEVATVETLFDIVLDVILNGTNGVTDAINPYTGPSADINVISAYNALQSYKATMQNDVLSWIDINHPGFTFDGATCARDVGYIIDSVSFDLLNGGNKQSYKSGVYYYGFSASQSSVPGEIIQVVNAFTFMKSLLSDVVLDVTIAEPYQTAVVQDNTYAASTQAVADAITSRIDTIIDIINNGPSAAPAREPIGLTLTSDADILTAANQLAANRDFIRAEVIAYIDATIGTFVYDQDKCSRDTGLIIDSIALDMLQDSTSESIFAGIQYWSQSGYVDGVGDQLTTTTAAINYVKTLAVNTVTAATTASLGVTVGERFDDILNILSTGTAGVTDLIVSNGVASSLTATIDAYNELISAKSYIQAKTVEYINSTLGSFSYDSAKCERDTGLIISSIALDLAFNSTSQSTFAGLQYWNQDGYTGSIDIELTTTSNAISYISELAQKIVVGDTSGTRYQSDLVQDTSLTTATSTQATTIANDFYELLNVLNTGTSGVTDNIVFNGITASTSTEVINAYNLLVANKEYLQAEAIAFVESTKTAGFDYDQTKCQRDIGYIVDSVAFDLLYGGNKQAIQSGVYYYGFDATSSAVDGETPQVLEAYQYIRNLLPNIIKSIAINTATLYSLESQVLGDGATTIEVEHAEQKLDIITNILLNGPTVADAPSPIGLIRSEEPDTILAAQLLLDNIDFIKAEVIAYADTFYDFVYDEDKCFRDVAYMIDSVAFDLLHGGNKQSIKSGVYYYDYTNTTEVPNEIPQTVAAYNFIRNIIPSIVRAEQIDSPYQDIEIQDVSTDPATDAEVEILQSKIDIITDIIVNGPGAVDARIPINLTTNGSSNISNAYTLIANNRAFIQAEVIAYLNTFGSFDYSREFCYRDVGILVENISYDASFGGNEKAVESGLAYYDGVVSKIAGQENQTVGAITYLNSMVQKIIRNQECPNLLAAPTYTQTINTALTGGDIASDSLNNLFNIVNDIITKGPTAAPDVYMGTNVDAAFVSAEILMQANKKFIQEDTINYINNLVLDFPYSERLCRRDTGLIVDSIAFDLLYPTAGYSQSTFAGLQYWNKDTYVGDINIQLDPTIKAVEYLRDLAVKIIQNITPADDLVARYQTAYTQDTSLEPATDNEVELITARFAEILEILGGTTTGWTDRIIPNGEKTAFLNIKNAVALLEANREYMANEVTAYVDATNANFTYDANKCQRDAGFMIDAVSFDMLHGGNRQSIQTGLYYFGFDSSTTTIRNQEIQTTAAFNHLLSLAQDIIQNVPIARTQLAAGQTFAEEPAGAYEAYELATAISTITNIIATGPTVDYSATAIAMTASSTATVVTAFELLMANRDFLIEETIAYIDRTYNPNSFNYDEALCYRDVGLIIDAVSQDILIGGNFKSIEAGLAYWNYGVSHVNGQETTTTMALNYAKDLALQVVANRPVNAQTATITQQIINPFFQYGGDYMPQEAIRRNFNIITTIINDGPEYAPPKYMGGGLAALTGINGADVLNSPLVVSVDPQANGTVVVGLNTTTVGFGVNSTLFFGETLTYPYRDAQVEALSLEYTGNTSTWHSRKTDPIGSMGGSLVDGAVISARSPIQSFVYDAFTQLTQGGRGVHIRNDGYAQLVSVFTIFASVGVQVDSGGIASIVNSNANFGDITLLAKGYGTRKFSGQIYNPAFRAYPESPGVDGFDQYYPNGFWPNDGGVAVFLPDNEDRPHISLVMEVEPPEGHTNEQGFPGFLNASPTTSTLTTGTISITDVDTSNVFIGNYVYVRDQYGHTTSTNVDAEGNWIPYVAEGTIVTDVGYNKIVLSKALSSGGGEVDNPNYFDFYFCGNAYYTVLSSDIISNPQYNDNETLIPLGVNILSTASIGGDISQIPAHVDSLHYLNNLINDVITNTPITALQSTTTQTILPLVQGGNDASQFINLRFGEIIDIVSAPDLTAAENVIRPSQRTTVGAAVAGAGSAISLIEENIEFLADEVSQYVQDTYVGSTFSYDETLCRRDSAYILTGAYYDVALGTNYNSVTNGLAYRRSVSSVVTTTELIQTINAVNYLKTESQTLMSTSTTAVSRSDAAFDEIMNILQEGEEAADVLTFPSPVAVDINLESAKNLLVANKEFIKAEILAWIAVQAGIGSYPFEPNFTYDSAKCSRDVGYIIDAIGWDLMFGSNFRSITAGLAYYRGNSADVVGAQKTATLGALQELKTLILSTVAAYPVAVSRATTYMNIIINIFDNGETAAPGYSLPNPPSLSSGYINARRLINANKTFIEAEIAAWIGLQVQTNTSPFTTSFVYDVDACKRDVGFIIDALRYDITYEGNLETIVASRAYFDATVSVLGAGEKAPTLAAYAYLKSIIGDIAQGSAITATTTGPLPNTYTQDTSGTAGSAASGVFLEDRIQEIYDTIDTDGTLPTEVTPDTSWVDADLVTAYGLMLTDKATIQSDIITFVDDTYVTFTYNSAKCARDVGYIVDALCYDILYGGNSASILCATAYFEGAASVLPVTERAATIAAFNRMSSVIQDVVQNIDVTESTGNTVIQNTSLPAATSSEATDLDTLIQITNNAINAGNLTGLPATVYPSISWVDPAIQYAVNNLDDNSSTLIDDMITYINDEFMGNFEFDVDQCQRDVKVILRRLIYDIESGGRYNSVMCGLSYWARSGTYHRVQLGENVTRTDLFPHNATVNFYQRSYMSASGYVFEYCGAGTNYGSLPQRGVADPVQSREVVMLDSGKVFFTSTDQNGDFRIGPGLVISQATGVLSGRTFTKSLFANMTPFILAIEAGLG